MAKKSEFSSTFIPEAEQPYPVPDNWQWVKLSTLVTPSKETTADFSSGIKYVGLEHMKTGAGIVSYGNSESVKSLKNVFYPGQILYGKLRPYLNKHDIATFSGVCSTDILVFNSNDCTSAEYINRYLDLDYFFEYILSNSKGIHLPRVTESVVLNAACPLPPLAEQQRIVDRIDGLFAKLDAARDKAQAVLDGYELRKAAILYRAFTGELTAEWRKNKGLRLDDWKHCRFCELCEIVRGGSPRPAGDSKYYNGTIPFMKVADITNVPGPYVYTTKHTIKEAGLKKTRMISPNTLLLTNSGATLGVPAICTFDTAINDGIAAFLNLNPDFILFYYYFWLGKTKELRLINMGMAQPNLNTNIIGNVEIDLPSDMEKQEIACIVDGLLSKQKQIYDMAQQAIDNIDMMKKAILGCAFRGELGTNDPAEECPEIANLRTN